MKRTAKQATILAYVGVLLMIVGFYPGADELIDRVRILHALWHILVFLGAALFVYGLETLRTLARRHRRMVS
jgi:predicted membrane channel-forming protein YqfA (hemolysin III family)